MAHLAFSTLRISLPSPLLHLLPLPGLPFRRACAGLGRCSERGASEASEPPSRCLSPTRIGRSLFRLSTAGPPVSSFSLSPARFPLKKASEKGQAPYRGRSLPALSSVGSTMPPLALLFFFFFFLPVCASVWLAHFCSSLKVLALPFVSSTGPAAGARCLGGLCHLSFMSSSSLVLTHLVSNHPISSQLRPQCSPDSSFAAIQHFELRLRVRPSPQVHQSLPLCIVVDVCRSPVQP